MTPRATRQVKELAGKVALVTGGAVRVGRVIALTLARAGADVAIGYRGSVAAAHATVADLRALGVHAVALRADIGRPAAARALVDHAARRLGRLDILVNNAAVFLRTPLADTTAAQWDRILGVNLRGAFFCAQAAARLMPRGRTHREHRGRGRRAGVARLHPVRRLQGRRDHAHAGARRGTRTPHQRQRRRSRRCAPPRRLPAGRPPTACAPRSPWAATGVPRTWRPRCDSSRPALPTSPGRCSSSTAAPLPSNPGGVAG